MNRHTPVNHPLNHIHHLSNFVELMLIIDRYLAQQQLGPLGQLDTPGNSAVLINVITGVSPPHFDFVVFLFYVLIATESSKY
jgi:hypothetical protein